MGSRSKETVGRRATSPGRQFKKPKKPLVIRFTDALEDVIREHRADAAKGKVRVPEKSTANVNAILRKAVRRITRGMARTMLEPFDAAAPVSRAERRRIALAKARVQMAPKKEVRA